MVFVSVVKKKVIFHSQQCAGGNKYWTWLWAVKKWPHCISSRKKKVIYTSNNSSVTTTMWTARVVVCECKIMVHLTPSSNTTIEWLLRGKWPRVCWSNYILSEVVTMSKHSHLNTVQWGRVHFFFFTFLVKLWTPENFFIPQKNRVGETRGKPLKLFFGYVCDFNLNCCGAVFFPEPNCVQKEPAPVHPATLRYRHQCLRLSSHFFLLYMSLSLSLSSPVFFSLLPYLSDIPLETELCLGSLDIYFNILCHLKQTVYCCSTATPPTHRAEPPQVHIRS